MKISLRPLKIWFESSLNLVWKTKGVWLRALLSWLIGTAFLISDQNSNYDLRFEIRGQQPADPRIVIVTIPERDWTRIHDASPNVIRPLKEIANFTDSFFWNTNTWYRLLRNLLKYDPAAIGVSFYFGENIRLSELTDDQRQVFENQKIAWGADLDSEGRALVPGFSTTFNSNIGIKNIRKDSDGIIRRFYSPIVQIPHLAVRLASLAGSGPESVPSNFWQSPHLINFLGPSGTFTTIHFQDIIENKIDPQALNGKIVIIGGDGTPFDSLLTPVGHLSRAELLATVTDNIINERWIGRFNDIVYMFMLALLTLFSIWVTSNYPQFVALVFFIWTGTLVAAISAWIFDSYYFWLPVLAPVLQLGFTYIIFLSYQLSVNEQKTWRLEQERRYLFELEQMKNNFVSLFSHDLKTPIAKIQAIVDRLLSQAPQHEFAQDLKNLRRSSDELHRYIQSILHITRVEAKDFRIKKEVTDINENIERVITHVMPLAAEKQINLKQDLEPMFSIEVDTPLIHEVILNLVENAIKYTPQGGSVLVKSGETDDSVVVTVEDTGPGIPFEEQKEVWGKFTRGKQGSMGVKGTGLGLYLVKYFIELHGGNVFLESEPGHGTKVGFSIPLTEDGMTDVTIGAS